MMPELAAHLWQSTLFAGVAWLVALGFRAKGAHVRYGLWFTASVKFLLPFSWLTGLGTLIPHPAVAPFTPTEWAARVQEISRPAFSGVAAQVTATAGRANRDDLAAVALVLWACGFLAVAICWLLRWRRMNAVRNSARAGSFAIGLEAPVPVMSAPDLVEPGIFGILRPVLLLPEGIPGRLSPTQLDAILAHEFCHVRRRDNLTAAIHMAVQAIFWFHPLTWWIGTRLVDERERACDEEVLSLGHAPNVYAESILTICKLYVSSPLECVSGVTGSDLKKRIEAIMRNRRRAGLNLAQKASLAAAGMATLAVPMVIGMLHAPAMQAQDQTEWQVRAGGKMAFEVASVKLSKGPFVSPSFALNAGEAYHSTGGRLRADFPLWTYIQFAYKIWPAEGLSREILAHLPKWVATDRYTIDARGPADATKDQMRLMVQALLAERFQLAAHFETREVAVFTLTLVKAGTLAPKLLPHGEGRSCDAAARDAPAPAKVTVGNTAAGPENFPPMCDSLAVIRKAGGPLMLAGYRNATMDMLATSLAGFVGEGRPVIDKTGLGGRFDFTMEWAPETAGAPPAGTVPAAADPIGPTPLQALREQLGLRLDAARGGLPVLVVDRVERPSEN